MIQYEYFISTGERLASHPLSYLAKDTLMKFRKEKRVLIQTLTTIPVNT